jgi:hypothetical protein
LLIFDDGNFSEDSTSLLTDWLAHSDKNVLVKNFNIPSEIFNNLSQKGKKFNSATGSPLILGREIYIPRHNRTATRRRQKASETIHTPIHTPTAGAGAHRVHRGGGTNSRHKELPHLAIRRRSTRAHQSPRPTNHALASHCL